MKRGKGGQERGSRVAALRDVTGGNLAEELLRLLSPAVEQSSSVVLITDTNGNIEYANPRFTSITGYTPEEAIGKHVSNFGEQSPEEEEQLWRTISSSGEWRGEFQNRKKNGERYWISTSIFPIQAPDGAITHYLGVGEDITERKLAEAALRQAEARNSALLEAIPDMMFRMSRDGVYLEFIPGKEVDPLVPPTQFLGRRMSDLPLPSDVVQQSGHYVEQALQTGRTQSFEYQLPVDDEMHDFEARIVACGEDEVLAIVRDVTERRRAEEALRRSEEMYRELVENINDAIYEVDTSGRITYISPIAEEISGYSPSEILGRPFVQFIPPEEAPARMESFRAGLSGQPTPNEFTLVSKFGETRWIRTSGRVIRDGDRITGFRGVLTDITERKRMEEALRTSQERYRVLYEDNPTMYFTVDAHGTVLSVNRFGAEQLGYTVDELIGQPVLNVFHEDDREDVLGQLAACVQDPGQVGNWEFRKVRKDGSVMWVKEAARAVPAPDGNTIVLIVCEDITAQKQTEEALQEAREELESRVESRLQRGDVYGLTFRELTVLHLVVAGESDKEIGAVLGISPRTVSKHVENILSKMNASSRTEAGVRAVREGLLE